MPSDAKKKRDQAKKAAAKGKGAKPKATGDAAADNVELENGQNGLDGQEDVEKNETNGHGDGETNGTTLDEVDELVRKEGNYCYSFRLARKSRK